MPATAYRNVLVTGATSGIGEALALGFARRGAAHLFICARDADRLARAAAACTAAGATVHARALDVADAAATRAWIEEADAEAPLDLVVANAGIGTTDETEPNIRRMFAINVGGVLNTVFPAIDVFSDAARAAARRRRQIAIVSSLTGYHGMPTCPSYSASKACVKAWGAGLRGSLAGRGIDVNVICPGFVRSRITDRNTCPMPFFMEAETAADLIITRLSRNIGLIAFPWPMRLAMWGISALPERLAAWLFARLPEKA